MSRKIQYSVHTAYTQKEKKNVPMTRVKTIYIRQIVQPLIAAVNVVYAKSI